MLVEGAKVAYIGLPYHTAETNAEGQILVLSGDSAHVMWSTGNYKGQVTLVTTDDLIPYDGVQTVTVQAQLAESLDAPGLSATSARETYDAGGEVELLNALNREGHLVGLSQVADDALEFVTERIRTDSRLNAVMSELDPDEKEAVFSLTASVLLRDAFGETDA